MTKTTMDDQTFLEELMKRETERKVSLDQRTVGVLTAGAALSAIAVSVMVALGTTTVFDTKWHRDIRFACLGFLACSIVLGTVSSALTFGTSPTIGELKKVYETQTAVLRDEWVSASSLFRQYKTRRWSNALRAIVLLVGQGLQALALLAILRLLAEL
jgi:hypothetical protein